VVSVPTGGAIEAWPWTSETAWFVDKSAGVPPNLYFENDYIFDLCDLIFLELLLVDFVGGNWGKEGL
jgi:hypothetical protein